MKTVKAQLFVTIMINVPDNADYNKVRDIINELDYKFQDTTGDGNVTDTCIDDFVTDFFEAEEMLEDAENFKVNCANCFALDPLSPEDKAHISPIVP